MFFCSHLRSELLLRGSQGFHDVGEQRLEGGGPQLGRDVRTLPREVGGRHRHRFVRNPDHARKYSVRRLI